MTFDLERLVRPNIRELKPYSSARSEFEGSAEIFLDANENAFGSAAGGGLNRYPDPLQRELKLAIGSLRNVSVDRIFVGNGSDEAIDLLFRVFCEPGVDECIICPPTYGMYRVSADVNNVAVREVPLTGDFQLDAKGIVDAVRPTTKLIFLCSPNNPTGNLLDADAVVRILEEFNSIVVVDEAYIDFAATASFRDRLDEFPNLVVLQTFSKAWGLAGLRLGVAYASSEIVGLLNRVKPPYNVSSVTQQIALAALQEKPQVDEWAAAAVVQRYRLAESLTMMRIIERVFPSDANFLLVKMNDARAAYRHLIGRGIVVRDRSNVLLCGECLRITAGTESETTSLITALEELENASVTAQTGGGSI